MPVPEGLDKWFAPINVSYSDYKLECDEGMDGAGKLTADRKAIFDIAKEPGTEKKLMASLLMMKNRGAGPWVLLTQERAADLKAAMEGTSAAEMITAAENKDKPIPESMQPLMDKVASYTNKEKKLIVEAKAAKEEKAAREAYKKVMAEIDKDPKAQEALKKPYPSESELRKDQEGYTDWASVSPGDPLFTTINGHSVILIKTKNEKRIGAYFKHYEKTNKGVTKNIVLESSRYYFLDGVEAFDNFTYSSISTSPEITASMYMEYFQEAIQKETFETMVNIFFNFSITFQ